MCGLVGWVSPSTGVPISRAAASCDLIKHRGPDDEGYWALDMDSVSHILVGKDSSGRGDMVGTQISSVCFNAKVALGHRRLSILDVSVAGHQPMISDQAILAFNGEIYNYRELRSELEAEWTFKSDTDTEVILAAYQKWNVDCFKKLDGMWAIAIFDKISKKLVVCRDRLGEKPLYFSHTKEGFFFSSEIKSLVKSKLVEFDVNTRAVNDYLFTAQTKFYSDITETMFRGIFEVSSGTYLIVCAEQNTWVVEKYWDLSCLGNNSNDTSKYDPKRFREMIIEQIGPALNADVPVAITLSGGVDSSVIASIVASVKHCDNVICYSSFTQLDDQDVISSKAMAEHLNLKQKWVHQNESQTWKEINDLIYMYDEPPKDLGGMALGGNRLYRAASEDGYKVIIEGTGPDELFAGYPGFFGPHFLFEYFFELKLLRGYRELKKWMENENYSFGWLLKKSILKLLGMFKISNYFYDIKSRYSVNIKMGLAYAVNKTCAINAYKRLSLARTAVKLNDAKIYFIKHENFPSYLSFADRNGMMYSVEGRQPFLRRRIVEYSMALEKEWLVKNGFGKYLLRLAFKNDLPSNITWRKKKQGFTIPESKWMTQNRYEIRKTLTESIFLRGYINVEALVGFMDGNCLSKLTRDELSFIWRCFALARWHKIYDT